MGRAPCCDKANVKKGPWSPEEDAKLKAYIEQHGTGGNWIALPQKIGLKRCGKSCRLRWLNYLRPNIKHGGFSEEEDNIICSLYVSIGSRWSIIAAQLPGRTDNDIKNYWNTRLKKKLLGKQRNNNKDHHHQAQAQARRVNTLKQKQQQDNQDDEGVGVGVGGVVISNKQNESATTPTYWPAPAPAVVVDHSDMPLIIPNNNIIQQQYYDQSSSSSSSPPLILNHQGGITSSFPHHHHYQHPYTTIVDSRDTSRDMLSFPQDHQLYPATTSMLTSHNNDANIFLQAYENLLFQTHDHFSHLEGSMQMQGFYGMDMESMEMASGSTGSSNTTTSTDQSNSYSWGDMSSLVINYSSPNLVSHHHQHYEQHNNACPQTGTIPPHQDASFPDSNRYYGIQLQ